MSKKMKINKIQLFRLAVQLVFLFLSPGLVILTFHEVGQIYSSIIGETFNFKQQYGSIIEAVAFIPLTILFGRFFCGWLCAFGTYNDLIYMLSSKVFKLKFKISEETDKILKYLKYVVLAYILVFIWSLGINTFSTANPWDAFAQLTNPIAAATQYTIGFVLLIFITIGAFFIERFFCRYLCPLGAIYSIISKLRIFNISKPKNPCGKCTLCTAKCSMGIDLYKKDRVTSGECINCMRCTEVCPRKNASASIAFKRVNSSALSAAAIAIFAGFYGLNYFLGSKVAAANMTVTAKASSNSSTSSSSKYKDGTYTGTGTGFQPGFKLSVTIKNGKISAIKLVSTNDTPRFYETAMKVLPQEIIAAQSTDVDTVSGATRSSNGIIEAVDSALNKASSSKSSSQTSGSASSSNSESSTSSDSTSSSSSSSAKKYKDGTYTGTGTGFQPGLKVSVKIKSGKITSVKILSNNETPRFAETPMQVIPEEIVKAQSTDVDTVSGATRTSNGIIEAVNNALDKASGSSSNTSDSESSSSSNSSDDYSGSNNSYGDFSSNDNNAPSGDWGWHGHHNGDFR